MKYIYTIIGSFTLFFSTQGQNLPTANSFNLQECINYAYEHQDSLKNARLDIESANYKVKETIGIGLPQVNGSASFQDFIKLPSTLLDVSNFDRTLPKNTLVPVSFGVKYQSAMALSVNQLLFDGSYLVGLQASKTFKELSEKSYNRTKVATTVAVTKAYYQVLVSNEQIKLLDANISQLKQQLNETTQLNKQGFVEKIDIDRITVLYNNLNTTRENTARLLTLGVQLLKFQIGMPVNDILTVKDKIADIKLDNAELSVAESDSSAYKNRIEYSLLETSKKLIELDLKRYKSQYLPSLSAFGTSTLQYQSNNFSQLYDRKFPNTLVGLQLNVPIFSGFQKVNRIKQAQIAVQKSQNVLDMVKNGINLQINQARILYTNGTQSLNNQRKNMELAQEILRVSRIKYEQGVGSNIEITQAQTSLQEAENNYIQALYTVLISKVDLDSSYGRIK